MSGQWIWRTREFNGWRESCVARGSSFQPSKQTGFRTFWYSPAVSFFATRAIVAFSNSLVRMKWSNSGQEGDTRPQVTRMSRSKSKRARLKLLSLDWVSFSNYRCLFSSTLSSPVSPPAAVVSFYFSLCFSLAEALLSFVVCEFPEFPLLTGEESERALVFSFLLFLSLSLLSFFLSLSFLHFSFPPSLNEGTREHCRSFSSNWNAKHFLSSSLSQRKERRERPGTSRYCRFPTFPSLTFLLRFSCKIFCKSFRFSNSLSPSTCSNRAIEEVTFW